jgi:hypothetical protein
MNATRSLTEFQQKCERELCSALAARGLALADRTLAGESETYIHASVPGTDIEVYIYEDEAQFHKDGKRAGVFEHQDFSDAAQLQKAFICGVIDATHDS